MYSKSHWFIIVRSSYFRLPDILKREVYAAAAVDYNILIEL
jgi:hypothetical protein